MSETSAIRVKTGQRWRGRGTGKVVEVYGVGSGLATTGRPGSLGRYTGPEDELRRGCTLLYDPDEGDAPEVGSRWRVVDLVCRTPGEEVTVERIGMCPLEDKVHPVVYLTDGDWYGFAAFQPKSESGKGLGSLVPITGSPSKEPEKPEVGSKWRRRITGVVSEVNHNASGIAYFTDGTLVGHDVMALSYEPVAASPSLDEYEVEGRKLRHREYAKSDAVIDDCPGCGLCEAASQAKRRKGVAKGIVATGRAIALFVQRAEMTRVAERVSRAQHDKQRAELLEHWMSLRPDDMHEGGWRRVGYGLAEDATRDDLDTQAQWMLEEMDEHRRASMTRFPCMQAEIRIYTEEAERGKWWR